MKIKKKKKKRKRKINRTTKKNKKKQMKLNYTHNMIKTLKKEKMDYDTLLSMNQLWQMNMG